MNFAFLVTKVELSRKSLHIYNISTYLFAYVLQGEYRYSLQVSYSLFLLFILLFAFPPFQFK